jgi:hypothetical protein
MVLAHLLGIIVYYLSGDLSSSKRAYLTVFLLGMSDADADWQGNFVGDLMWTVEPLIILGSPFIFQILMRGDRKKEKAD